MPTTSEMAETSGLNGSTNGVPAFVVIKDQNGWQGGEQLGQPRTVELEGQGLVEVVVVGWLPVPKDNSMHTPYQAALAWPDKYGKPSFGGTPSFDMVPTAHLLYLDEMEINRRRGGEVIDSVLQKYKHSLDIFQAGQQSPLATYLTDRDFTTSDDCRNFYQSLEDLTQSLVESARAGTIFDEPEHQVYDQGASTRRNLNFKWDKDLYTIPECRASPIQARALLFQNSTLKASLAKPAKSSEPKNPVQSTSPIIPTEPRRLSRRLRRKVEEQQEQQQQQREEGPQEPSNQAHVDMATQFYQLKDKFVAEFKAALEQLAPHAPRRTEDSQATDSDLDRPRPSGRRIKRRVVWDNEDDEDYDDDETVSEVGTYRDFERVVKKNQLHTNSAKNNLDAKINRDISSLVDDYVRLVAEAKGTEASVSHDNALLQFLLSRIDQLETKSSAIASDTWEIIKNSKVARVLDMPVGDSHRGKCFACKRTRELSQLLQLELGAVELGCECGDRISCVLRYDGMVVKVMQQAAQCMQDVDTGLSYSALLGELKQLETAFQRCIVDKDYTRA